MDESEEISLAEISLAEKAADCTPDEPDAPGGPQLPFSSFLGDGTMNKGETKEGESAQEGEKDRQNASIRQMRGAGLACGIFTCLISYGYFQEKIMTGQWGDDKLGGKQISSVFLVMCNRLTSLTIAIIGIVSQGESFAPGAPVTAYSAIAFSNMMATTCQYEALRYVSFPTQTLAKTAKMIPVMIWGTFLAKKTYKVKDYVVAAGVTVGATFFLLTGDVTVKQAKSSSRETSVTGMMIMIAYLFFDGFTSTVQERLFKDIKVSTWNQMLYVGLLSALVTGFVSGVNTQGNGGIPPWDQDLYMHVLFLSLSAAIAQIFILILIKEFGALIFATVMTTRQFLSILLSCLIFLHPLTLGQWVGTVLVFGSLYYKTLSAGFGGNAGNKARNPNEAATSEEKQPLGDAEMQPPATSPKNRS